MFFFAVVVWFLMKLACMAEVVLYPFYVLLITIRDGKGINVGNGVVIRGGVVLVDEVNQCVYLVVGGRQLESVSACLGRHSSELQVGPLEVALVLVGSSNEPLIEKFLHEPRSMLVIVHGQVGKHNATLTGFEAACLQVLVLGVVVGLVGGSVLVPGAREDVLWLVLIGRLSSRKVTALMVIVLISQGECSHSVGVPIAEVILVERIGMMDVLQISSLRCAWNGCQLDGLLDEGLVIELFVDISKELLV